MQRFGENRGFSHLCRGSTIEVETKKSTDLHMGRRPKLKSVEFFVSTSIRQQSSPLLSVKRLKRLMHLLGSGVCCRHFFDFLLGRYAYRKQYKTGICDFSLVFSLMRTIMKGVHGIAPLGHFVPVFTDMNQLASKENRIKRCQGGLTRSPSGHADR